MAKSARDKKREARDKQWLREDGQVKEFQRKAPYIKKIFRARGFHLPFYDYYDSYVAEFERISVEAKAKYPTLVGIFEADDAVYFSDDRSSFVSRQFAERSYHGPARRHPNKPKCAPRCRASNRLRGFWC